uniref:Uncharacterized protein n=1 Tax=Chromera velia CCMP2878 TaxID=1169474 RepID=A0A0G4HLI5_9ALVE|eukprot:Cvel_28822.t1-p1 / transcript=Cvel_28822.t1 / gene=Cvel_28822 / organism=Chromera_velia_CCMP2878 / gene_product=hypothetical protein / transcript_product=hypothetical protein / location=Cvel_scaffold3844:1458-9416(+) / protein_length=191 / sequence_SO=supercontig / SO=protein_coding / is_pseudo=false
MGSLGLDLIGPLAKERDKRLDLFATLPNRDSILGDVALIHPIQDTTRLHRNAKKAGAVAKEKEGKKHTYYDDACRAVGIRFVPLVFETYGRPGGETVRFVKEMVRQATKRLGEMNNASAYQKIADKWWKTLMLKFFVPSPKRAREADTQAAASQFFFFLENLFLKVDVQVVSSTPAQVGLQAGGEKLPIKE